MIIENVIMIAAVIDIVIVTIHVKGREAVRDRDMMREITMIVVSRIIQAATDTDDRSIQQYTHCAM
jgi:hypothetical protein